MADKNKPELSFHRFPKDAHLRSLWLQLIGRADWQPKYHDFLCSKHFAPEAVDMIVTENGSLKAQLVNGAVPFANSASGSGSTAAGKGDLLPVKTEHAYNEVVQPGVARVRYSFLASNSLLCCVPGCMNSSRTRSDLSFHQFPRDAETRSLWLKAMGREDWDPSTSRRICSEHFEPSDLGMDGEDGRKRVVPGAVPTRFPFVQISAARRLDAADAQSDADSRSWDGQVSFDEAFGDEREPGQVTSKEEAESGGPSAKRQRTGAVGIGASSQSQPEHAGIFIFGEQDYAMQMEAAFAPPANRVVQLKRSP